MIKILLVEKHLLLSNTLKNLLNQEKEIDVVGVCTKENEVIEFLNTKSANIVMMDHLQINALVIIARITKKFPKVKVIGFSTNLWSSNNRMVELGAFSHLSKYDTTPKKLIDEIKKCYATMF